MSDSFSDGVKTSVSFTISQKLLKLLDDRIRERYKLKDGEKTTGLRSREVERYIEEGINRDKAIIRVAR